MARNTTPIYWSPPRTMGQDGQSRPCSRDAACDAGREKSENVGNKIIFRFIKAEKIRSGQMRCGSSSYTGRGGRELLPATIRVRTFPNPGVFYPETELTTVTKAIRLSHFDTLPNQRPPGASSWFYCNVLRSGCDHSLTKGFFSRIIFDLVTHSVPRLYCVWWYVRHRT